MGLMQRLIQHYGDEKSFIKKFIHALTAADSRIICNKTDSEIDTMFAGTGSPAFALNCGDMYTINFVRSGNLTVAVSYYNVNIKSCADTGTTTWANRYLYFSSGSYGPTAVTTRSFWLSVAANDKAIAVILGNHDNIAVIGDYFIQGVGVKEGNDIWFSANYNNAGTPVRAFFGTFFYVGTVLSSPVNRLAYVSSSTNTRHIEIIKSKAVIQNGQSSKLSQTDAIYDCSTLPFDVTRPFNEKELIIGSRRYYALTPNTLIPV